MPPRWLSRPRNCGLRFRRCFGCLRTQGLTARADLHSAHPGLTRFGCHSSILSYSSWAVVAVSANRSKSRKYCRVCSMILGGPASRTRPNGGCRAVRRSEGGLQSSLCWLCARHLTSWHVASPKCAFTDRQPARLTQRPRPLRLAARVPSDPRRRPGPCPDSSCRERSPRDPR